MTREIYKNGSILPDEWEVLEDDAQLPVDGNVIVSFQRYFKEKGQLKQYHLSLGVIISPGDDVSELQEELETLQLVAVDFPGFADGRGFSSARILREEMGFTGEIRASGQFILDQISMLTRCGVNSFALDNPHLRKDLEAGNLAEVTVYSQPVGAVKEVPVGTRPWARRKSV
ncbi:DUF934 domain-containing protein [Flexibacterium corallicola]|uniref:DUF934 domain-containing protein n=1 Tax=Flexibacterium corallicola TaxID=3037259 RepID=UPI00286F4116|nr:DUF934 domain-containing protein [Pseudovibrio sp. M1P-2-3]